MEGINFEVTTRCPLKCPQCYCSLTEGKHLDITVAKKKIEEAAMHGVKVAHVSGGETLCYPYIYELIECLSTHNILTNVAISGYSFDDFVLQKLRTAGVHGIFVSLNGASKEINSLTRDGFDLAINALEVLKNNDYPNAVINWVMHSNNCDDFENMLTLAEKYNVSALVILAFKPDSHHELRSFPSGEQMVALAKKIKAYKGTVKIVVESCFSQLLAIVRDTKLFGNLNVGPTKGCRAGVYNYCINVDGMYSPCRHLDYYESFETLDEYLTKSSVIQTLKTVEDNKKSPCDKCRYSNNCRPCMAVSSKLHNDIYIGHEICSLWNM